MNNMVKKVYKCYLGSSLMYRTVVIHKFVSKEGGKEIFKTYGTSKDSISGFIKKVEEAGIY